VIAVGVRQDARVVDGRHVGHVTSKHPAEATPLSLGLIARLRLSERPATRQTDQSQPLTTHTQPPILSGTGNKGGDGNKGSA